MIYYTYKENTKIPAIGLGTWKSKKSEVTAAVQEALKIGYRHIDCARVYQNEDAIGDAFSTMVGAGGVSRDQLWVTSKLWNNAHLPEDVEPAESAITGAIETLEELNIRPELARCYLTYARLLKRWAQNEKAESYRAEALGMFEKMGMRWVRPGRWSTSNRSMASTGSAKRRAKA